MTDTATRKAMHVLLDLVASQDQGAPDQANLLASQTAFEGFDSDAIKVTEDDETGEISVDPSALITAAGMIIVSLLGLLADDRGQDQLTVLHVLRDHLDGLLAAEDEHP